MPGFRPAAAIVALLVTACPSSGQPVEHHTGYDVWPSRVLVEGADAWRAWDKGQGAGAIEADGTLRPRFMRRDINAALNAADFVQYTSADTIRGGISATGVAADSIAAPLVIDGDEATYWEPDLSQALDDLWLEIDLGRTVISERVTVRFVGPDMGDPFLQFRVLTSDGTRSFGTSRRRQFVNAGQVRWRNKEQRAFTFEIGPVRPSPEGLVGRMVQYVRVDLLGTDGERGREIDATSYALLPAAERGAVDYHRVTPTAREIRVVRETYDELPEEERGPIRYYRRERPRLAEVEVHALGDNVVAVTQGEMPQGADLFSDLAKAYVTDGFHSSQYSIRVYDRLRDRNQVRIDLGARFWLDRVRLLAQRSPLTAYEVLLSDGSLDPNGEYVWQALGERLNASEFVQVEESFPLREVRLLELHRLDLLEDGSRSLQVSEIQAYGEGYVSELVATSPLMRLPGRRMLTRVRWEGDEPLGTELEVRTRSGDQLIQIPHYYRVGGREVNQLLWERLPLNDRGPVLVEELPGADWSPWCEPYEQSGDAFRSPGPRQMVMAQVRLRTREPLRRAAMRSLELDFEAPLLDSLVAEIDPIRDVPPGTEQEFALWIRTRRRDGDPGIDRLRLSSSSTAPMELLSVRSGSEEQLASGGGETLWPGELGVGSDDGIELRFPSALQRDELLEVRVRTRLFLPSTTFRIDGLLAGRPGTVQTADAGDAHSAIAGNSLVVTADLRLSRVIGALQVRPGVLTPNGDGINDLAAVEFEVYQLQADRPPELSIHDLSGRRVRLLAYAPAHLSGEHRILWDGRNDRGEVVPPGSYVARLRIPTDADIGGTSRSALIHVAY